MLAIPITVISTNFNQEFNKLKKQREKMRARILLLRSLTQAKRYLLRIRLHSLLRVSFDPPPPPRNPRIRTSHAGAGPSLLRLPGGSILYHVLTARPDPACPVPRAPPPPRSTGLEAMCDEIEEIVRRNLEEFLVDVDNVFEEARIEITGVRVRPWGTVLLPPDCSPGSPPPPSRPVPLLPVQGMGAVPRFPKLPGCRSQLSTLPALAVLLSAPACSSQVPARPPHMEGCHHHPSDFVCACVCACVRVCMCACVRVCVYVRGCVSQSVQELRNIAQAAFLARRRALHLQTKGGGRGSGGVAIGRVSAASTAVPGWKVAPQADGTSTEPPASALAARRSAPLTAECVSGDADSGADAAGTDAAGTDAAGTDAAVADAAGADAAVADAAAAALAAPAVATGPPRTFSVPGMQAHLGGRVSSAGADAHRLNIGPPARTLTPGAATAAHCQLAGAPTAGLS